MTEPWPTLSLLRRAYVIGTIAAAFMVQQGVVKARNTELSAPEGVMTRRSFSESWMIWKMNSIQCPKCSYHQTTFQAPKGKVVRNPYAAKFTIEKKMRDGVLLDVQVPTVPVYDDCNACDGTGNIPQAVVDSVTRFGERTSPEKAQEYLSNLRWSSDHYSFMVGSMYVGVETDGYLHT